LANLAILKLHVPIVQHQELLRVDRVFRYQFNPDLYNPDVVINILIKALTASPLPDFNLCISLLDERPSSAGLDEPDPLPILLPLLKSLNTLLLRCRFPAFWELYHSVKLEALRENYTVECKGFEDAVRKVAIRAVKAAFTQISTRRLGSYFDLDGLFRHELNMSLSSDSSIGPALIAHIQMLGWTLNSSSAVVTIPPNPDNQIEATVVQESVNLPRQSLLFSCFRGINISPCI